MDFILPKRKDDDIIIKGSCLKLDGIMMFKSDEERNQFINQFINQFTDLLESQGIEFFGVTTELTEDESHNECEYIINRYTSNED